MEKTKVIVLKGGPIIIEGDLEITHADGTTELRSNKTALCRCGFSKNKPYCDGVHKDCPSTNEL